MPTVGVEFAKVSYTLAGGHVLLRDVSLALEAGKTTALLGRSGSGKTTLLRMVNGLVVPSSGSVKVMDKATTEWDLRMLRRRVGYVIQETGLFPHMTISQNVELPVAVNAGAWVPPDQREDEVKHVLESVGLPLGEYGDRYPWQLSGGQRQRAGVARALVNNPDVLLMDEPFGALDPITRAEMQTMLRELLGRVKKTTLLVTHDLDEALYLADRVVFLAAGHVVADLLASEVLGSGNAHVKDYVNAVHRAVKA